MILTIKCSICQQQLLHLENKNITDSDVAFYRTTTGCDQHGPFIQYDQDGNQLPIDDSNIVSEVLS